MDDKGVARISEYGLEQILHEEASSELSLAKAWWLAPEIIPIKGKSRRYNTYSIGSVDVYSLGMVMSEVGLLCLSSPVRIFDSMSDPRSLRAPLLSQVQATRTTRKELQWDSDLSGFLMTPLGHR